MTYLKILLPLYSNANLGRWAMNIGDFIFMKIPKKINSVSGVIELEAGQVYLTVNDKKYKIKAPK